MGPAADWLAREEVNHLGEGRAVVFSFLPHIDFVRIRRLPGPVKGPGQVY